MGQNQSDISKFVEKKIRKGVYNSFDLTRFCLEKYVKNFRDLEFYIVIRGKVAEYEDKIKKTKSILRNRKINPQICFDNIRELIISIILLKDLYRSSLEVYMSSNYFFSNCIKVADVSSLDNKGDVKSILNMQVLSRVMYDLFREEIVMSELKKYKQKVKETFVLGLE